MKRRDIQWILVFLCTVYAISALNGVAALTFLTFSTAPTNLILDYNSTYVDSNLRPGDSGVLQIVVKNTGGQVAENVQIFVPDTQNIKVGRNWDVGRIEVGQSKTLSTTLHVSENAYVGLHTIHVSITYDGYDINGERKNDEKTSWDIPVRVYGEAKFRIEADKISFPKDVTEELKLKGSTKTNARSVSTTLTSNCVSVLGSAKQYLGDLNSGNDFSLSYQIKPTQAGVCPLSLVMEYFDSSGNSARENISLGIEISRSSIDLKIIDVEYDSLALGGIGNITIKLKNVGNLDAEDTTVLLNLSKPLTPIKSSEKFVGKVSADETKEVRFSVAVDSNAESRSYAVPILVRYYDIYGTRYDSQNSIGVQLRGSPEIEVSLEDSNYFKAGSSGKVGFRIVNKGFLDAEFLKIRLNPTADYRVLSVDTAYIGKLNSDDFETEDFEISVNKNVSAKKIPLSVEIEYKEKDNDAVTKIKEDVYLNLLSDSEYVKEQPTSGPLSTLTTAVAGILGLIVLYLVLWFVYKILGLLTNYLDKKIFKKGQETE